MSALVLKEQGIIQKIEETDLLYLWQASYAL
jgi:hypothetical protein